MDPELAGLPELVDGENDAESDNEDSDDEESVNYAAAPESPVEPRRSARIKAGVLPPESLTFVTKIKQTEWDKLEETSKAVTTELK